MTGTVAVVPAAGSGERLAAGVPKAFYQLDGRTLVERAGRQVVGIVHDLRIRQLIQRGTRVDRTTDTGKYWLLLVS